MTTSKIKDTYPYHEITEYHSSKVLLLDSECYQTCFESHARNWRMCKRLFNV